MSGYVATHQVGIGHLRKFGVDAGKVRLWIKKLSSSGYSRDGEK